MAMHHSYGWRPSLPDHRTVRFTPPRHLMEQGLPPQVNLRPKFGAVQDQLTIGACGPGAASGLIQFDAMGQGLADVLLPSRLFIYWNTRQLMGTVSSDSGVDNLTMLKALAALGFCDESYWPYNIGQFKAKPPQAAYQASLPNKISGYAAVNQTLNELKAALAAGRPMIFGFSVYESFEGASTTATGDVPMPGPSEQVLGGHDVLICGYSDATNTFDFRNDWGDWGNGGYGRFPYAFVTNQNYAGDSGGIGAWLIPTVPGGVIPPPNPPPPNPPPPPPNPPPPPPNPPPPPPNPPPPPPPGPPTLAQVLAVADASLQHTAQVNYAKRPVAHGAILYAQQQMDQAIKTAFGG